MTRRQVVIVTGVSVYLLGMAFACGMAVERIRLVTVAGDGAERSGRSPRSAPI
jgi:hypothetical protein